jgi:pimeloyl-ACP methyl ester carboxylesterase
VKTTRSKDGTTLAYDVHGSGPELIYITGASCFRSFKPILQDVREFAKEFTVYNYDRRGRGDSGDTLPYSLEREVEDIEAMIDAAGGRAYLYGHSSGAVLALEAALRLGEKVRKAVLYDASYVHDETEKAEYGQLRQRTQNLLEAGKNSEAMSGFLNGIGMPKVFVFLMRLMPDWRVMTALAPTLAYDMALTSDLPPLERAVKVSVPVQVVVGEKSPIRIRGVGEQLANAIPNTKLVTITGQDHMVNAKTLLPVLSSFLKQ